MSVVVAIVGIETLMIVHGAYRGSVVTTYMSVVVAIVGIEHS